MGKAEIPTQKKKNPEELWSEIVRRQEGKGFSRSTLGMLAEYLDIPNVPMDLQRVLKNAQAVFQAYAEINSPYHPSNFAPLYQQGIQIAISILTDPMTDEILAGIKPRSRKRPAIWGYYLSNPLYAAFWETPDASHPHREKYIDLLAHISVTVLTLKHRAENESQPKETEENSENYQSAISTALPALRKLAEEEHLNDLAILPNLKINPEELAEILEHANPIFHPIVVLIQYLLEIKKPPQRSTSTSGEDRGPYQPTSPSLSAPAKHLKILSNLDKDQEVATPSISLVQMPTKHSAALDEAVASGLAPEEFTSRTEIISLEFSGGTPTGGKSPRQQAMLARQAKTHLAMRNQLLPFRWERLSMYEISTFLLAVNDILTKGRKSSYLPKGADPLEISAFVSAMFWLSLRPEDTSKLLLFSRCPNVPRPARGFLIQRAPGSESVDCCWLVTPAVPKRKILPTKVQQDFVLPISNYFFIDSGLEIEKIFVKYAKTQLKSKNWTQKLFPKKAAQYEEAIKDFLTKVNRTHHTRLTSNRVSDHMFHCLVNQKGSDLTYAMYLTGRDHFLGRVLAHYSAIPVTTLQNAYRTACANILASHCLEQGKTLPSKGPNPSPNAPAIFYIGSPYCPTTSTVTGLSGHLRGKLEDAKAIPGWSIDKLLRVHNSMVRYTAFLMGCGVGFRGVREPILLPSEINWRAFFAVFTDKDNEDRYNERPLWVPEICITQLRLFWQHMALMHHRLWSLCPEICTLPNSSRGADQEGIVFMVKKKDETYEWKKVSPAFLMQGLTQIYPLPINTNRHYLRTRLLGMGCPSDIINLFMGHWERGEEPYGRFSALSPKVNRQLLSNYLNKILKESGWEPISGLEVG